MKNSAFQLTLREMQELATSPRAWGIMAVVIVILGISGPFQTFEYLPIGPRFAYWAIMTVASYGVGSFFGSWGSKISQEWQLAPFFRFLFVGFSSGIPVGITVITLNVLAMGDVFSDPMGLLLLAVYCIGISLAIVGLFMLFNHKEADPAPQTQETAQILSRIPVEKRGGLISLSVQDHYVEVVTTRGKHLTLIRLSDAIGETNGTKGLQIHRSHWVALEAINAVKRNEGKVIIHTKNGGEFPVSRTYIPALKETGLLV